MKLLTNISALIGIASCTYLTIAQASEEDVTIQTPQFQGATQQAPIDVRISGYLETYYLHDFNRPTGDIRPGFTYSHNVTDKPSINLGLIKASVNTERMRANLALGSGTYMRANYALEPRDLQKIFEANVGLKLTDNVWLDAGVMPSHIGFESAIGLDNWTLTRSMLADNSPYFETGVRLSYTSDDGKWYASGLLLNGWQRIQRPDGNTTPAIGHQLTYKPNANITLNSSSFIGNDKSDNDRRMRYFHNFYGQYQLNDRWGLITGFDIGAEQTERNSKRYNVWLTPIVIAKYTYSDKLSLAVRAEYYQDKDGVIVTTDTPNGFRTFSYSTNLDYRLSNNVAIRAELRKFHSQDKIFEDNDGLSDESLTATTAVIFNF
ncbi:MULTISPECIES: porin [unclassified Methylotenera]|uniref:porin n=1 Tax=unclassified Methylotenera TaxID=2643294 RepID=UPI0003620229|nr:MULTISPECIES: porin [unclassified Methylotenera]